jgi:hypothetical protein
VRAGEVQEEIAKAVGMTRTGIEGVLTKILNLENASKLTEKAKGQVILPDELLPRARGRGARGDREGRRDEAHVN